MAYPGGFKAFVRDTKRKVAEMPRSVEIGFYGPSAKDAQINEFGVEGGDGRTAVPERPVFRTAIAESREGMAAALRADAKANKGVITDAGAKACGEVLKANLDARIESAAGLEPNASWKATGQKPLTFTGKLKGSTEVRVKR